jgi:hypothetical protein
MLFLTGIVMAQTGINYKAAIKDVNGNLIASQAIDIVFSIQHENVSIYSELQQIITDNNGIAIATIGNGTPSIGTYETIDWKLRDLELNVQLDLGEGFVDFGNSPFNTVPYAINTLNPQGLEAIDEGNGIGWRLAGSNPDDFGNIGIFAIDLSFNDENSNTYGATGPIANAFGRSTTASGLYSTAMGGYTEASGQSSTAMGFVTEASGNFSTATGNNTIAQSAIGTAIGRYNIGGGNPTEWIDSDPLFEIGNGLSNSNRRNALTVLKNGQHIINSEGAGLLIPNAINAIIITESQANSIAIVNPGFHGMSISNSEEDGIVITNAQSDGIIATANNRGAFFSGGDVGVFATASNNNNPDIILGGTSGNANDNGIISSNPQLIGSDIYLRSNDAVVIELDYDDNGNGNLLIKDSDNNDVFEVNESGNVNMVGRLQFASSSGTDASLSDGTGFMVLGSENGNNLVFDGNEIMARDNGSNSELLLQHDGGNVRVGGTVVHSSDKRLKRHIEPIDFGLNEILQLNPKQYFWKNRDNQVLKSLGLIAQEVQPIIKNIVFEGDDDMKTLSVSYTELIPVLINAIKEQQKIIEGQNEALETSKNNYEALLSRIEILESKS